MKIQGFNNHNIYFGRIKTKESHPKKSAEYSNFIFLDEHLLDFGIPKKVAFVRDHDFVQTNVMLYDEDNKCFYSELMPDNEAEAAEALFMAHGVEEFVYFEEIKGGEYGQPKQNPFISEKTVDVELLGSKEKAKVMKALLDIEQKERLAKTYLKTPALLDNSSPNYSMSYPAFIVRTLDCGFDMDGVLNNLNISTRNAFKSEDIERITVSPDGMQMRIQTLDGKSASLNFINGARNVYDSDIDSSGFGTIMIMDKNGPILKRY